MLPIKRTYVDAPELLDRIERDDLLEKFSPVVALHLLLVLSTTIITSCLRTLPLGGLVNHRVQVFMSGCLTLKLSASWKTVRTALSSVVALVEDLSWASDELLPSTGEIGIVSRGTGWEGFGAVATSAIVLVVK